MDINKQDTEKDKQAESGRWGRRVKYLMAATMAASGASGYVRHSGDAGKLPCRRPAPGIKAYSLFPGTAGNGHAVRYAATCKQVIMCTRTRAYLTLLREYKAEIVMIVGFAAAAIMYADMRTFINEQTRTLTEINLRLSNLEHQTQK